MDRRRFLLTSLAGVLVQPLAAAAQARTRGARIGYRLRDNDRSVAASSLREAFLNALRELGYIEGQNLTVVYRTAEGKIERLPALAAELVAPPSPSRS
jgi:putative ABC transport system substrate-binding protein